MISDYEIDNAIFTISNVPHDIFNDMVEKNIWNQECPVSIDRLRLLNVSYVDFNGNIHNDGKIMVLDELSQNTINIFKELLKIKFPMEEIRLANDFNGDEDKAMHNNTSCCFNSRQITGGGPWSIHSYGAAIDINPQQNPYIKGEKLIPSEAESYIDRKNIRAGMVEPIVGIFNKHGFDVWGGNWKDPIDYMHFQISREKAEKLSSKSL